MAPTISHAFDARAESPSSHISPREQHVCLVTEYQTGRETGTSNIGMSAMMLHARCFLFPIKSRAFKSIHVRAKLSHCSPKFIPISYYLCSTGHKVPGFMSTAKMLSQSTGRAAATAAEAEAARRTGLLPGPQIPDGRRRTST